MWQFLLQHTGNSFTVLRRKEKNHHKYLMDGIIVKYFPECYRFDETELNRILSAALATRKCRQIIESIKKASSGNADIYQNKNAQMGEGNEEQMEQ